MSERFAHFPKLTGDAALVPSASAMLDVNRNVQAYWTIEDGEKSVSGECKSFVGNFAIMARLMVAGQTWTSNNSGYGRQYNIGSSSTVNSDPGILTISGPGGCTSGAFFFSGTGAAAVSMYDLGPGTPRDYVQNVTPLLITSTDSADQLTYSVQTTMTAGATADISEVGMGIHTGASGTRFTLVRDIVSPTFHVVIGNTYTIRFTFNWQTGASSYLKNFAKLWRGLLATQNETLVDVNNTSFTARIKYSSSGGSASPIKMMLGSSKLYFGQGSTAVVMDDHALTTPLATTSALTNLDIADDATHMSWLNNAVYVAAAPTPSLTEMGVTASVGDHTTAGAREVLILRTVLPTPTPALAIGDSVNGKYTHNIAV